MGVLEQLMNMKKQGIPEGDIIKKLREQGISPREITEALNQAQIKNAVYSDTDEEEMQPSILERDGDAPRPMGQKIYAPKSLEVNGNVKNTEQYPQEEYYQPEENQQYPEAEPQTQQYQQDYYQPQEYASQGKMDTETIMDISEQVVIEKTADMLKQLSDLNEFKTLNQSKIQDIEIRLRRIETIMDKLQILILEKVGSYGENLNSIKKEMSMMQDSFGKMINPVLDDYSRKNNYREELSEDTSSQEEITPKRKPSKR
ncbi:MAG: hypothetical protein Q7R52_04980 [archaeon]|nr:hypothetical protein [archaeon]